MGLLAGRVPAGRELRIAGPRSVPPPARLPHAAVSITKLRSEGRNGTSTGPSTQSAPCRPGAEEVHDNVCTAVTAHHACAT